MAGRSPGAGSAAFVYMPQFAPAEAFVDDSGLGKAIRAREGRKRRKRVPVLQWLEDATALAPSPDSACAPRKSCSRPGRWWMRARYRLRYRLARIAFPGRFRAVSVSNYRAHSRRKQPTVFAPHGGQCVHAESRAGLATFAEDFFDRGGPALLSRNTRPIPMRCWPNWLASYAPGGVAIVKVPNYGSLNRMVMGGNWCGFRIPDHVNYFTKSSSHADGCAAMDSTWNCPWSGRCRRMTICGQSCAPHGNRGFVMGT